jgi:uncharacterized membrane protein
MLPDPLHPAVVHLPIALAVVVPLMAIVTAAAVARGLLPARSWALVVLLQVLLVGSGWFALETGEEQEERVERVVAESHIEDHEENAELFLSLAGLALVVLGAGLVPGRPGAVSRVVGTLATLVVLAAGVNTGHSGGHLVYVHGAANAYLDASLLPSSPAVHHEDDDD